MWRRQEECLHQHFFREPNHEKISRGRPQTSFVEQICEDPSLIQGQIVLRNMQDRVERRRIFKGVRVRSTRGDDDDDDGEKMGSDAVIRISKYSM